jgi:hypothetical protein
MMDWLKSMKLKLIALLSLLLSFFLVYLVGRRNRKGELRVGIAQRELELANQKHEQLEVQLNDLHNKRVDIAADILAEETARMVKQAGSKELSDDEIISRLKLDGLIK